MPALIIIACIILFFAFILSLRAKITIEYNDELSLIAKILFIKIRIFPKKDSKRYPRSMSKRRAEAIKKKLEKKAEKKRLKKLRRAEKKRRRADDTPAAEKPRTLSDVVDMISTAADIVKTALKIFFGHLRVDLARLHVTVAAEDAATTAIYYGIICDALTHLLPVLESVKGFKTPKAQDISVRADYLAEHITADLKISMSIRVWHILHVGAAALRKLISRSAKKRIRQGK